ncbi:MAG: T9SS type A sorting domain-containing protein [Bacteroidota bacterium]
MKKIILACLTMASILSAQDEFFVNTRTDTTQRDPQIVRSASGYAVIWNSENYADSNSEGDIVIQLFNMEDEKISQEILLSQFYESDQEKPCAAMNSRGDLVAAWGSFTDNNSIYDVQVSYTSAYQSAFPGIEFQVNSTTLHTQTNPACDIDEHGNFIIAWESWYQDGSNRGVYAQRYDSSAVKVGDEFLVNTTTANSQARPAIKYFNDGSFILIWESWGQEKDLPTGYGMFGKIYNSSGNVRVEEFQINTYENDYQWFGDVEVFENLSFVASWCSWEQDGFDGGIYLQKFDADGNKIGGEILANTTKVNYQWLPRIKKMLNGNIAVVWSSWREDGNREGVLAQIFDGDLNKLSFQTIVNQYSNSYQWEPDFIVSDDNQLLVTWSSWGELGKDFEIMARRVSPEFPQAVIDTKTYLHTSGKSSSKIIVHVVDSTKTTGDTYQVTFNDAGSGSFTADIKNTSTNQFKVENYPLNKGEGVLYKTETFDGIAVEVIPIFNFILDKENSYFVNNSGSNLVFTIGSGLGLSVLAPIDMALIWGKTDTLSDGSFSVVLDSAYNSSGKKKVKCPFYAWNLTDNEKMDMVIIEPSLTANIKWDAGEQIGFLTPSRYTSSFPRYHASLLSSAESGKPLIPNEGDKNVILTKRPLSVDDIFTFTTDRRYITTGEIELAPNPENYRLMQNYPNPFNPSTVIKFQVPSSKFIKLQVYDMLGREIKTLVNEYKTSGNYEVEFDGSQLASGIYFYQLQAGSFIETKKMILIK